MITNMINGNEGLNENTTFSKDEIKEYIEVTQNGNPITDFEVIQYKDGKFGIKLNDITDCDGLTIKQTYKEPVMMYTYLLYSNVIPSDINQSFSYELFGPSGNNTPYDKLYWDINKGLDDLREQCGIFIDYGSRNSNYGAHTNWYVSKDNYKV